MGGRLPDSPLFDFRNSRRDPNDTAGTHERPSIMGFGDKVMQHPFGHGKIGDHSLLDRSNGDDIPWGTADHFFGFISPPPGPSWFASPVQQPMAH